MSDDRRQDARAERSIPLSCRLPLLHLADIVIALTDVRFGGKADIDERQTMSAFDQSGHSRGCKEAGAFSCKAASTDCQALVSLIGPR